MVHIAEIVIHPDNVPTDLLANDMPECHPLEKTRRRKRDADRAMLLR